MKLKNPERIAFGLFILAAMFKVMHWPFSGVTTIIAVASVIPALVYSLSKKQNRSLSDYARAIFISTASFYLLFRWMHWPYVGILMIASFVAGAFWAATYLTQSNDEESEGGKHWSSSLIYGLGAAMVVIGALFKIMHWPYGFTLLITGILILGLWFLADLLGITDKRQD